jgi:hypothetical protein
MLVALAAAAALLGPCRTVHGRMDLWNGAPTVRIWVVGAHRVLGVEQLSESFDDLPPAVRAVWTGKDTDADWATAIYGDFRVCAVTKAHPGGMQRVRILGATHLSPQPRR